MKLTSEQIKTIEEAIANGGDVTLSFPKPKPEKWEPPEGDWIFNKHTVSTTRHQSSLSYHFRMAGTERQSENEAEIALAGQKRRNIISAWAAENGGEQKFVKNRSNWYVYFSNNENKCNYTFAYSAYHFETVYMTKEAAKKFSKWYNKGRIEL